MWSEKPNIFWKLLSKRGQIYNFSSSFNPEKKKNKNAVLLFYLFYK